VGAVEASVTLTPKWKTTRSIDWSKIDRAEEEHWRRLKSTSIIVTGGRWWCSMSNPMWRRRLQANTGWFVAWLPDCSGSVVKVAVAATWKRRRGGARLCFVCARCCSSLQGNGN
jgi:hypothetical protein